MTSRKARFLFGAAALGVLSMTSIFVSAAAQPTQSMARPLYKDAKAPIDARVADLLSRMTLEEKTVQITAVWDDKAKILDAKGELDPSKIPAAFPSGIGQFARSYLDLMCSYRQLKDILVWGMVDSYSWLQNFEPRSDRLPTRGCPYDADFVAKPMREAIAASLISAPAR